MKITSEELKDFPLATIAAGKPLPLLGGVNPAWTRALAALHQAAVIPVFGAAKTQLTEAEWMELCGKFSAFDAWQAAKVGATVEKLGATHAREILGGKGRDGLVKLFAEDQALVPAFKAISEVNRLAH